MRNHNRHQNPPFHAHLHRKDFHRILCSSPRVTHEPPTRLPKAQKVIDNFPIITPVRSTFLTQQLIRNKSVQLHRREEDRFRGIINQLNDNNERTLEQLDGDLKRIKSSIGLVEGQLGKLGREEEEGQVWQQQVRLLEEENQRLREKNLQLLEEKKKLISKIEHYEDLYEKQVSKVRQEDVMEGNRKGKEDGTLKRKMQDLESLRKENEILIDKKLEAEKRYNREFAEKNKISQKLKELERQIQLDRKKWKETLEILQSQLRKKESNYRKKLTEQQCQKRKQDSQLSLKNNKQAEFLLNQLQEQLRGKQEQIRIIQAEMRSISQQSDSLHRHNKELENQLTEKNRLQSLKIQNLTDEIEHLTFAHNQLTHTHNDCQSQLAALKSQYDSLCEQLQQQKAKTQNEAIKYDEQHNRYLLLQELYDRIEREAGECTQMAEHHVGSYKINLSQLSEEVNRLKRQLILDKQQNELLNQQIDDLSAQKQQLTIEISKRGEQILQLKHQCYTLTRDLNTTATKQRESLIYASPSSRRERFNSGDYRAVNQMRERENANRLLGLQKELDKLMGECKAELKREKKAFKVREKQMKGVIQSQKYKIGELARNCDELRRQLDKQAKDKQKKDEEMRLTLRRKQQQIGSVQTKHQQMSIEYHKLQTELKQLSSMIQDTITKLKKAQVVNSELSAKINEQKKSASQLLKNIVRQVKSLAIVSEERNIESELWLEVDEGKVEEVRVLADLGYAIRNVRQVLGGMAKKTKKLQEQARNNNMMWMSSYRQSEYRFQTDLTPRNTKAKNDFYSQSPTRDKDDLLDIVRKQLYEKLNEMQSKLSQKSRQMSRLQIQYDSAREDIVDLGKTVRQLREQLETAEKESDEKDRKLKEFHHELRSQKEKEEDNSLLRYLTPLKHRQSGETQQPSELKYATMRQRVRSVHNNSPAPYSQSQLEESSKLLDLQMTNVALSRNLEQARSELLQIKTKMNELDISSKVIKQKHLDQLEVAINQNDNLRSRLKHQDGKIQRLQKEIEIITRELDKTQQRYDEVRRQLNEEKQQSEFKYYGLLVEKEILQRIPKHQSKDKETELETTICQKQHRINQLTSKLAAANNKLQLQTNQNHSQYQRLEQNFLKIKSQLKNSQQEVAELKQKLRINSDDYNRVIEKMQRDSERLVKILQEKEIELQQLKFIQESTMINMECIPSNTSQLSPKKRHKDSIYSFTQE